MWRNNNNLVWGVCGAVSHSQLTSPTVSLNAREEGREGGRIQSHLRTPITVKSRNKWQPPSHPFPRDKCDFQCHLIAQKCTAERSAFRERQNDLGDISDSWGDAPSLCPPSLAADVCRCPDRKRRRQKGEEMEVGWDKEMGKKKKKAVYWYCCKFSPGQLWQKWMIFIKSLGFVSSISYISPNRGRPSLYSRRKGVSHRSYFEHGLSVVLNVGRVRVGGWGDMHLKSFCSVQKKEIVAIYLPQVFW